LRFGHATGWSIGLAAATWAFAASSLASLLTAGCCAWKRRKEPHRLVHYHGLAVAILLVVATLYLAWHGMIGYRS
jgi:hypothetical protein